MNNPFKQIIKTWFGPGQAIKPVADKPADQTQGRNKDYQSNYNILIRPRSLETYSFNDLRSFSENCDILATVIQTRKDEISRMNFSFISKKENDPRVDQLNLFFKNPDKINTWKTWIGSLIHDLLTIDTVSIYPRKTFSGGIYSLEIMDPATITKKIDAFGRTPVGDDEIAYQQIIKGVPAINYNFKDIIYRHKNIRSNKIYGYSPVEQIINTINTAILKQAEQMNYYIKGNTPDLILTTPEGWSIEQIASFSGYWNELNQGQSKKETQFAPNGAIAINTKPEPLKNEFDEWLTRIICYAFSVSPQPFIDVMNRATAQTAQETASAQGMYPMLNFIKELMDFIIYQYFGFNDIEFIWNIEQSQDPFQLAQSLEIYTRSKILTINEAREILGKRIKLQTNKDLENE